MKHKEHARLSVEELEQELKREKDRRSYGRALRGTLFTLITVAAAAVLVATLLLPVLRIYGGSMSPTLQDDEIVVAVKGREIDSGDIVAFYYNNRILVKRVIARSGDWVNIDGEGNVYVNDKMLDEPYLKEKSFGEADIELPYQVPDGFYFVIGDNRATSVDSRHQVLGCLEPEYIVGKIVLRVWPLSDFGKIN